MQPDRGLAPLEQEREVVLQLKAGDRMALAQLYDWYGDRLFRQVILPRLPITDLAEDVLRDTFRICIERIEQYNPADRSIFFWMRRIAINRAIDVHRAHQRRERLNEQVEHNLDRTMGVAPPAPDRGQEVEETRDLVEEALQLINPRYAQALRLRLIEDKDREECAQILGVTVGNFDVILHRATKAFRKKYPPR
ncbi:MAG: sigma-70 family RNA polymerase sigma factor [Proteobacteria bacterium]|nr:sigma-70 family RNA polymerase sigma factor [Pseudomonadota bacterium]